MTQAFQDMDTASYGQPSFESPHNNVHDATGCPNGTMYDLHWSAFDPLFMLHHTNVDRLIALWQAVHPNATLTGLAGPEGALYATAAGNVSADTPLKPFRRPQQQQKDPGDATMAPDNLFHTSRTALDVTSFGYSYPELALPGPDGWHAHDGVSEGAPDAAALEDHVRSRVNALYGANSTSSSTGKDTMAIREDKGRRDGAVTGMRAPASRTWSVALRVDRAQVALPAAVRCHLGGRLVGKMVLLAVPAVGVTHSTVRLDAALSAAGLDLTDEDGVMGYLARKLKFDVKKVRCLCFS